MLYFNFKSNVVSACFGFLLSVSAFNAYATVVQNLQDAELVPTGKGWAIKSANAPNVIENSAIPQNGIYYHGGPVMGVKNIPNVYYIWYGNWSNNSANDILTNLAENIGRTSYYNINTTYTDSSGNHIMRAVNYQKAASDNYSQGKNLSDNQVFSIVKRAINNGSLPLDSNGIYFVLTSADVNETSGFCSSYCGWHTNSSMNNKNVRYAFVGNAARCLSSCAPQSTSPNSNPGADGMASVISHELEETVTDPNTNAWYDRSGEENADKCAWKYGTTHTASNGSKYNLTIGSKQYLIQMNWLNANGGLCTQSY
jgi:hypothetical protein